jgi:glycerophosphoryl diester phosphodiesterase
MGARVRPLPSATARRALQALAVLACSAAGLFLASPAGAEPTPPRRCTDAQELASIPLPETVTVIAHRGGAKLAPENTIYAFRRSLAMGAGEIELDIHQSKDGQLVVMHDGEVSGTTNGKGQIPDLPWSQLSRLNAAGGERSASPLRPFEPVPRLDDVFDLLHKVHGRVMVEIKMSERHPDHRYPGIVRRLVKLLKRAHISSRVEIASFDLPLLAEVRRAAPRIRTVALLGGYFFDNLADPNPEVVVDMAEKMGAGTLAVSGIRLSPALVQLAHCRGLRVYAWTIDEAMEMDQYVHMGVDGIITDRPDTLLQMLRGMQAAKRQKAHPGRPHRAEL